MSQRLLTYQNGWDAGMETARQELLDHRRIAARWAKARLERVDAAPTPRDQYGLGYLAGYRATLVNASR